MIDPSLKTHSRYREKMRCWCLWLSRWNVSTVEVYRALFRLKFSWDHGAWMRRAVKSGVLVETPALIRGRRSAIYSLGPRAALAFPDVTDMAFLTPSRLTKLIGRSALPHDLAAQWFAAGLDDPFQCEPPAGLMADGTPDFWRTDADNKRHAVEIELTRKSGPRIYRALSAHMERIREGDVRSVTYCFVDPAIRDAYVKRFRETTWPQFRYFAQQRKYVPVGQPLRLPADDIFRSVFNFEVIDLWPISRTL